MIVVVGNLAYDLIGHADELYEEEERCSNLSTLQLVQGGRGGNLCMVAGSLGSRTVLLAHVGKDFASSRYEEALLKSNVDLSGIYTTKSELSAHAFIFGDGTNNRMLFYRGLPHEEDPALLNQILGKIGTTQHDYLVATSGLATHNNACLRESNAAIRIFAPGHDVYLYTRDELLSCIGNSTAVIVNSDEASLLEGRLEVRLETGTRGWGIEAIVVTAGADGCTLITRTGAARVPAFHTDMISDTIGAGDAFAAGFVHFLGETGDYLVSARLANAVASLSLEGQGCQGMLPVRDAVLSRATLDE